MFIFVRTVTYSALFIGFVLIYAPGRVLSWSGIARPATMGAPQVVGMLVGTAGAVVALWCIAVFASIGRGTPMPLDPPRRLVIKGPYCYVRNPMYIGAALALAGGALVYESLPLLGYAGGFLIAMHLFVVWHEEPALRRTFGPDYEAYCGRVRRWRPRI